jgi:hypothetical protein
MMFLARLPFPLRESSRMTGSPCVRNFAQMDAGDRGACDAEDEYVA